MDFEHDEDDDLFLSDIGDLSQIYHDGPGLNRGFSGNTRHNKKFAKNKAHYGEEDSSSKRFKSAPIRNRISKSQKFDINESNRNPNTMNSSRSLDDKDVLKFKTPSEVCELYDVDVLSPSNITFYNDDKKKALKKSEDTTQSKLPFTNTSNNRMEQENITDDIFLDDEIRMEAKFGERFNGGIIQMNIKGMKNRSVDKVANSTMSKSEKLDSNELLDENYPSVMPFKAIKSYKPLRFSFDKSEEKKLKTAEDSYNEQKIREVLHGLKEKSDDDDLIIINETEPRRNTQHALRGQTIPVLSQKSESSVKSYSTPVQYNAPLQPPAAPSYSNLPNYSMNNVPAAAPPNFMNSFNQDNSSMYPPYGAPSMMNTMPPVSEFYNPPQPSVYPSFHNTTHPPPPISNNWMASMNPSMVPPPVTHSNQCSVEEPPPPSEELPLPVYNKRVDSEAVKNELRQQNMSLALQRDTYLEKYKFLNEELEKLKKQKKELLENKKSYQNEKYLKTNQELQFDIQNKLKAVKNVIDVLSKIVKDDNEPKVGSTDDDSKKKENEEKKEPLSKSLRDKKSRRHSRSHSRSRHRSRSRSRGRRSQTPRSKSRSYSPGRYRRRSRSRGRKYSRRRSSERKPRASSKNSEKKRSSEEKKEKTPVRMTEKETSNNLKSVNEGGTASQTDSHRFKATFEEVKSPKVTSSVSKSITQSESVTSTQNVKPVETESTKEKINYVYYDPEIHWCQVCDLFPRTAKEYLQHLHDAKHKDELAKRNMIDYPWHKVQTNSKKTVVPDAPTERVPIRGLPFFVSAAAWYCKLCNEWMGDLHCASAHLKSELHENKYKTFIESNPLWEETWTQSRSKALELYSRTQPKGSDVFTCAVPPPSQYDSKIGKLTPQSQTNKQSINSSKNKNSSGSSSSSSSSSSDDSSSSSEDENDFNLKKKKKKSKKAKRKKQKKKNMKMNSTNSLEAKPIRSISPPCEKGKIDDSNKTAKFGATKVEDDKFVEEWMNPIRSTSTEREFNKLKDKLKKKENEEKNRTAEQRKKLSDIRKMDSEVGRLHREDKKPDESLRNDKNGGTRTKKEESKKILSKPIVIGKGNKFPFIGKMPFKTKKPEPVTTKASEIKKSEEKPELPLTKASNSQGLSEVIKKHLEQYEKTFDAEQDNTVVDMDINEEEDEPVSIVVDENISRQKDFEETLKILYPEEGQAGAPETKPIPGMNQSVGQASMTPQDYFVSLIENTVMERLKVRFPGVEHQNPGYLAQLLQQSMIPACEQVFPFNAAPRNDILPILAPPNAFPPTQETIYPPGTSENIIIDSTIPNADEVANKSNDDSSQEVQIENKDGVTSEVVPKKKKNPISQKKRRHLAKIRQKLEEQEKELQAKIEQTKKNIEENEKESCGNDFEAEMISEPAVMNVDSDLMLLGIDESDSAALQF